ncbi:MAG: hypothetical protein ACRDV9_02890 [Acidimicrobiia bacterium]
MHDHGGSAGALVVLQGRLQESWAVAGPEDGRPVRLRQRVPPPDHAAVMSPGHVHDLTNPGEGLTLSVHVYSPPLQTMTFFGLSDDGRLVPPRCQTVSGPEPRQCAS